MSVLSPALRLPLPDTRRLNLAALAFISIALLFPMAVQAQQPASQAQIESVCLLRFAKYVDWPAESFPKPDSPLVIAVAANATLATNLDALAKGAAIDGHAIVIRLLQPGENVPACHVLFLGGLDKDRVKEMLTQVRSRPVLTVGEGADFEKAGGMVAFVLRKEKVRFDINADAAGAAGLRISSRLLTLADTVRGKSE